MAELVRLAKSESLVGRLGKEYSSDRYLQQYYLRNKDKYAEYRSATTASRAAYQRQHYLETKDKKAAYKSGKHEWMEDWKRQYNLREKMKSGEVGATSRDSHTLRESNAKEENRRYYLQNLEKNHDYRIRHGETKLRYQGKYTIENREKVAEYQQIYNRDGNLGGENRRRGRRKEFARTYFGYQQTWRSWKSPERVREYLDSIASELSISSYEDWYRISRRQMDECGGLPLHNKFGSLGATLQYAYPEIKWDLSAFKGKLPVLRRSVKKLRSVRATSEMRGRTRTSLSWKTPELVREYFESVVSRLNISNFMDWYRISRRQIRQYRGESLYTTFGSLGAALQFAYPEIKWDLKAITNRGKKSGQRWLKLKIKEILPGVDIIEEYLHPDLNWVSDSDQNIELDLWIPQHRIGIEYQGQQHYFNVDSLGPSSAADAYSERDKLKNHVCESQGITLIAIPYWWDGSVDSLSGTLYQARPDVFPVSQGRPIPREKPTLSRGNYVKQLAESTKLNNIE